MRQQGLRLERLEQEIAGAGTHRVDGLVHLGVGRHQHDRQMRQAGANFLEQRDTVHRHHPHIADDDGKRLLFQHLERRLAAIDSDIGTSGQFQRIADRLAQAGVVFDDEDGQAVFSHGFHFQARIPRPAGS